MSEPDFSPQLIQFSEQKKLEKPVVKHSIYGEEHLQLQQFLDLFSESSPWQEPLQERLKIQESCFRCNWVQQQIKVLKQSFSALIETVEEPAEIRAESVQILRKVLLDNFANLRQSLQIEYLPLLKNTSLEQGVIQALIVAQLNRLDALQLMSAAAFDKSVLISQERRKELHRVGDGVLPDELLALLELEALLDAAARYQFAWNRIKTQTPEAQTLSELQSIALQGLKPGLLSPTKACAEGVVLDWQDGKPVNALGISIDVYRKPYVYWMKIGIHCVQRAMKQKFQRLLPLEQALEAFYAALSVEPDRVEAPLALAWLLTLLNQSVPALDFLEYSLKLEARPEIQQIYVFLQKHHSMPQD